MKNPIHSIIKRAYRLGPARPRVARRRGCLWLLSPHNWIDNRLLAGAPYEDAQIAFATTAIQARGIDTVIDIGANFGLYAVTLGRVSAVSAVVAFEPVGRNFAQLMANAYLNDLCGKLQAHAIALGDGPGDAVIHVNPASTGTSRLGLAHTKAPREFSQSETVRVAALDGVIALQDRRIFMKVDVEGHAEAVITGAARILQSNDVLLQLELTSTEQGAAVQLAAWGYVEIHRIEGDAYFAKPVAAPAAD